MNITMIGMPACGKSTIGVMLAKRFGMSFVDIDILIQEKTGKLLKEIIASEGNEGFLKIEGDIAAELNVKNSIIAPGGSICYEDWAMDHLKEIGKVVYLKVSYEEMEKRIGNVVDRGVAIPEGYTLKDLYDERTALYEKYADVTIDEEGKNPAEIVNELKQWIEKQK
ncbi:shikimate kinase [Oribacterium sp. C9]|uniref:shikimate kinase n=1 Tax=Oribacterium sp. C9 TaxID=1943579 RepID=UPI00098F5383|nr:shikimate kinase [Oribacterium sp. C9]OON88354.1 shikimate kinase [Oribacterium sp. C9]